MIQLNPNVESSSYLKSLLYWNAFRLMEVINDEDRMEEMTEIMVENGGFGYEA